MTVPTFLNHHYQVPKKYQKGSYIFREGDTTDGVYQVLEGRVKLMKKGRKVNRSITFHLMNPLDVFGILENLTGQDTRRCAAVAMDTNVRILYMPFEKFSRSFLGTYEGKMAMIKSLHADQNSIWNKHNDFRETNIAEKVFRVLQELANQGGIETARGTLIKGISHKELAHYIGLSRQIVTVAMNDLKRTGKIEYSRKQISILKFSMIK